MTRKVRIFVAAFIIVSVIGLTALVAIRYIGMKGIQIVVNDDEKIGLKVSGIHYSRTREGRTEWVLDADSAASFTGADELLFNSVTLVFYGQDGSTYSLKAATGSFSESTGDVYAKGDVLIESADGAYSLKTQSLKYSSTDRNATTDDRVEILTKDLQIEGEGLIVEIDKEKLFILDDVKVLLKDAAI